MTNDNNDNHEGLPPKGEAGTAWEDQGSVADRLSHRQRLDPGESSRTADEIAARDAELAAGGAYDNTAEYSGDPAEAARRAERRASAEETVSATQGRAGQQIQRSLTRSRVGEQADEALGREPEIVPAVIVDEPGAHLMTPEDEKRAARLISLLFLLSGAATIVFLVCYVVINVHKHPALLNMALGLSMALAMFLIGAAAIVWAKTLMPHEDVVQKRKPDYSPDEDVRALAIDFAKGTEEAGVTRRKMLLGSMGVGTGLLALPPLFLLRDLGPNPNNEVGPDGKKGLLNFTAWRKDARFVEIVSGRPLMASDIVVGSLVTVVPEGREDAAGDSTVMLVRLQPRDINTQRFGPDEVVEGLIAYSKICTHAGCPVSLYEQQRHHFLCPCHQSTFDAADAGKVLFGPAARALPRLPFYVDSDGYLRAKSDFRQPVGPSFWERG